MCVGLQASVRAAGRLRQKTTGADGGWRPECYGTRRLSGDDGEAKAQSCGAGAVPCVPRRKRLADLPPPPVLTPQDPRARLGPGVCRGLKEAKRLAAPAANDACNETGKTRKALFRMVCSV